MRKVILLSLAMMAKEKEGKYFKGDVTLRESLFILRLRDKYI